MVMRKHQRYFPVYERSSPERLLPHFITVANGPIDPATVIAGAPAYILLCTLGHQALSWQ
jgi:glycyl-tRNA synthetase